ncbi:MAG: class I SAM-dependent methyltransferase [Cyclobacteriaceae bacterium]
MSFIRKIAEDILNKTHPDHKEIGALSKKELAKTPSRTEIINFVIQSLNREVVYLEIGVRNPDHNFNKIVADRKYSVDPGVEFEENPVDFKLTSDEFYSSMRKGEILKDTKFDVVFIDGLHLAEQVERDINNSLEFLKEDGYIIMHDCNPPSEWHSRESYNYKETPAQGCWNGTTWKAFIKARTRTDISACCVDTDWGVGIISKKKNLGESNQVENPYFEYSVFNENRKKTLNLLTFEEFQSKF